MVPPNQQNKPNDKPNHQHKQKRQDKPNQPYPQNEGAEKPYPHFPCTEKPCAENEGAKSNSLKSNSDKSNHAENQQSMSKSTSKSRSEPPTETSTQTPTMTLTQTLTQTLTPTSAPIATLAETPARTLSGIPVMNPEIPTTTPTKKELPSSPLAAQSIGTDKTDESSGKNRYHGITYEALEATVRANIRYEDFVAERHPLIKLIDEIVHNMLDVLTSTAPYIRIKSREKETAVVKAVYMKLGYAHIAYVVERFRDVTYPIVHKGSYLKTLLYTSLEEMESYYENQYRTGAL